MECKRSFLLIISSSLLGEEGVQLLSLSCVTRESQLITLRSQGLPSVPPFFLFVCFQRLLFLAPLQRSEKRLLPALVTPPTEPRCPGLRITTSGCRAQPAQTLSPRDFHSCCALRLFDHLNAMGACRAFPGRKLCKWQVPQHPPADPWIFALPGVAS